MAEQIVTRFPLAPTTGNWATLSVTRMPLTDAEYRQLRSVLDVVLDVLRPDPALTGVSMAEDALHG